MVRATGSAGFQLLGHRYDAADGVAIDGAGLVDVVTSAGPSRLIGEVVVEPSESPHWGPGGPPPTLTGHAPPRRTSSLDRFHLDRRATGGVRRTAGVGDAVQELAARGA